MSPEHGDSLILSLAFLLIQGLWALVLLLFRTLLTGMRDDIKTISLDFKAHRGKLHELTNTVIELKTKELLRERRESGDD